MRGTQLRLTAKPPDGHPQGPSHPAAGARFGQTDLLVAGAAGLAHPARKARKGGLRADGAFSARGPELVPAASSEVVAHYPVMWEVRRHISSTDWQPAQEMAGAHVAELRFAPTGWKYDPLRLLGRRERGAAEFSQSPGAGG